MSFTQQAIRMPREITGAKRAPHVTSQACAPFPNLNGSVVTGGLLLGFLVLFALVGPAVWTTQPEQQDLLIRLSPPMWLDGSVKHPLGSDKLGRDTLALLMAGARTSLAIAAISSALAATIGTCLGLLSGFRGGWLRAAVDWATDVQLAIPFVVVAIALTAAFGHSFMTLIGTLVATGWLAYGRVVQLQVRALRQTEWILAAQASGATPARIMFRHLAPSILGTVGVLLSQQAGAMIFYEASLSFLGLGLGGNTVTLGGLVSQGREVIFVAPWLALFPGLVIAWAILGFNLLGDGIGEPGRSGAR